MFVASVNASNSISVRAPQTPLGRSQRCLNYLTGI